MAYLNIRTWLLALATLVVMTVRADYADHRNRKVDSLETVLKSGQRQTDRQLIVAYKDLMWGLMGNDAKRAEGYARKALALSYRHDWLNSRVDALRGLGLMAYGSDRFDESEAYFMQALAVADSMRTDSKYSEQDIDDCHSALYGSLGNLYNVQDKTLLAIEYYQKAEPIFQKYGWKESLTILHHNIAELYLAMGNTDEAERHYLQATESGQASGDSLLMALPAKGLVKIYIGQNDYEKAHQTLMPAYRYYRAHAAEEHGDLAEVLASMVRMNMMEGHEDLAQARAYANEALGYAEGELLTETRFDVYLAAAAVEMKQGNWQQALKLALNGVHERDDEATFSDVGGYEMLANIYLQLGNKTEASRYMGKMRQMMERFATSHYQSGLSQMEVLYETKKKQDTINQLQTEKRWYQRGALLIALLLMLAALSFYLLWRSVGLKRKSALFKARLDGEVEERNRIARDLHDGLGGMLSLLRLKMEVDKPKEETLGLLDSTIRELRHVAHHLMPEQLLQGGLSQALHDLAVSVPGASYQHFGSNQRLSTEYEVVLYRCAYELVNNALKHAKAQRIGIQLMQEGDSVTLTVGDDGKGMAHSQTDTEGMGLQSIRERIGHYRGELNIVSSKDRGTEINITLPL